MIFLKPAKICLTAITVLLFQKVSFSQITKLPAVLSDKVASLGKYGTYDVNYNTGSPNITVPLYSLKTSFLPVDIYLNYDSKGFMPNESGYDVGKNWNIVAGGAITRIVNGEPDDKYNPNAGFGSATNLPEIMQCEKKGYIYGLTSTTTTYTTSYINNLSNYTNLTTWSTHPVTDVTHPNYNLAYEHEPDMFSFTMLGYSGKFFMGNDGSVKVVSDKKFKVDFSQLGNRFDFENMIKSEVGIGNFNTQLVSVIKLTSDDGTEFTFGGACKDIEISVSATMPMNEHSAVITAWYLTKVKNKNGEEINFINDNFVEEPGTSLTKRRDDFVFNGLFDSGNPTDGQHYSPFYEIKYYFSREYGETMCNSTIVKSLGPLRASRSVIKKCYLKKIQTDLEEVEFNYTKNQRFYTMDNPDWIGNLATLVDMDKSLYSQHLSGIQIRDRKMNGVAIANYTQYQNYSPVIKTILFTHSFIRNYLFLKSVNNSGMVSQFIYNNEDIPTDMPQPMTYGIDYLGYYNGENSNTGFIGGISSSTLFNVHYPTGKREPNPLYSTIGILKEITHPTGGKTELEFENHFVGKWLEKTTQSPVTPAATDYTGNGKRVPGLRIKKIKNVPGETVEFKYVTNWESQSGMISTGILNYSNATGYYFEQAGHSNYNSELLQENNLVHSATYFESPVSYSEVVKKYNEGFEKYKFSTHLTNPDRINSVGTSVFHTPEVSGTSFINQMDKIYFRTSSTEIERGKLIESLVYDNSNNLRKRSQFFYNTDPLRFQNFGTGLIKPGLSPICVSTASGFHGAGVLNVYENFYYQNLVSKEIVTEYGTANGLLPLTTTTEYQYISNTNPLLRRKKIYTSTGDTKEYSYAYAEDAPAGHNPTVLSSMISKNMTGNVLQETVTLNGSTVLTKNIYLYGLVNSIPELVEEKTVNAVKAPSDELPVLSITKYTSNGNIAESALPNNISVTYKWDYEGSKMVAKVENAQETDVRFSSFENAVTSYNALTDWQFNNGARVNDYFSVTGRSYYNLAGNPVQASNLNSAKTYILSFWKKEESGLTITGGSPVLKQTKTGVNGWSYAEYQVTGTTTVQLSGTAKIDELRLYPAGALMTSYTHEALTGNTSVCDVNNNVSYFEYDSDGRLRLARDMNRNIIKKYKYKPSGVLDIE